MRRIPLCAAVNKFSAATAGALCIHPPLSAVIVVVLYSSTKIFRCTILAHNFSLGKAHKG